MPANDPLSPTPHTATSTRPIPAATSTSRSDPTTPRTHIGSQDPVTYIDAWSPKNGLSGSQGENGACRSEGLERLVAGQHVPDRLGQLSGELDLRDFRAALATQAALGALVALLVERVRGRRDRGLHQPPAQVFRAVLGQRPASVHLAGLAHARAQAGVSGQ